MPRGVGLDTCSVDRSRALGVVVLGLVAVAVAAGWMGIDIPDTATVVLGAPVGRMRTAVVTLGFGAQGVAQLEEGKVHVVQSYYRSRLGPRGFCYKPPSLAAYELV